MRVTFKNIPDSKETGGFFRSKQLLCEKLAILEQRVMDAVQPFNVVFDAPKIVDGGGMLIIPSKEIFTDNDFLIVVTPNVADNISPAHEEKCARLYKVIYDFFRLLFPEHQVEIEIRSPVWVGVDGEKWG